MSKASLWLTLVCAAAILLSCDAWDGGEVGLAPPPAATWSGVEQFGTAGVDSAQAVAVDSAGSVYTSGLDNGALVVRKFLPSGTLAWASTPIPLGADVASARSISVASGLVYVAGMTFVPIDGGAQSLGADGFVVRFGTSNGSVAGILEIRDPLVSVESSVAADGSGNIYVASTYLGKEARVTRYSWPSGGSPSETWSTPVGLPDAWSVNGISLGTGQIHIAGLIHSFPARFFLARLSTSSGAVLSTVVDPTVFPGAFDASQAICVVADALNNTYICGNTTGDFAGANAGGTDILVAKYDTAGNLVWGYQVGTAVGEVGVSIALSGSSVYVAGSTFGNLKGQTNKDPSLTTTDAFLIRIPNASSGPTVTEDWVRLYGSTGSSVSFNDLASGVATDPSGNVFVVGQAVGFMESATQVLENGDGYVLKVSPAGVLQ